MPRPETAFLMKVRAHAFKRAEAACVAVYQPGKMRALAVRDILVFTGILIGIIIVHRDN